MVLICIACWLIFKRWWLGALVAGLVAMAFVMPSLMHLDGTQRGAAFGALAISFGMYAAITLALYGLRVALTALWRAVRPSSLSPRP